MSNLKHIIEGNWDEIKGKVQTQWGKLTDNDLDKINGSYKVLAGKLQKAYGYKASEVEKEISEFFESTDFDDLKDKFAKKIRLIKSVVFSTMEDYYEKVKNKSMAVEQSVEDCITEHPVKVVTLAAGVGLLAGYLLNKKRN
jgi:uncharacterized protein YjbJ (UPF0337 family)